MELRITTKAAAFLDRHEDALLLAVIMNDGEVRLEIADAVEMPGHLEWIKREKIPNEAVRGGFSLIMRDRKVTHVFISSRLNPSSDGALRRDDVNGILKLLPLADTVKVL